MSDPNPVPPQIPMALQPPPMPPSFQMMQDADHLRVLSILHYVMAGFSVLGAALGAFYIVMGMFVSKMVAGGPVAPLPPASGTAPPGTGTLPPTPSSFPSGAGPSHTAAAPPPEMFSWMFGLMGIIVMVISVAYVVGHFITARNLAQRRGRTWCFVMSGLACMHFPLGTALGIFTIIVLCRPSVTALFNGSEGLAAPPPR